MKKNHVSFMQANDEFWELSTMAESYPVKINGQNVPTIEHLFHALKFSGNPEIQKEIIKKETAAASRIFANKASIKAHAREDWDAVKVEVMEFCVRAKLLWHWVRFGKLLKSCDGMDIYEVSRNKDKFWRVVPETEGFVGGNHIGRILMKVRDEYLGQCNESLRSLKAPDHLNLKFLGGDIEVTDRRNHLTQSGTRYSEMVGYFMN